MLAFPEKQLALVKKRCIITYESRYARRLTMLSFGNSGYGVMRGPDMPLPTLAGGAAAAPTVTRVAVSPAEAPEASKAASGEASDMGGARDGSGRPSALVRAATEDLNGYSWKVVYESGLRQVFLELVERDSDMVVMRIPSENLAKFLRNATDVTSARHVSGRAPLLDMVA